MPRIYKLTRAGVKILYKIRHHRGHGIHSPFVFNLVTKVVEEKMPYHAYEDIRHCLERAHYKNLTLNKQDKLFFRLSNYFSVKHILEFGSGNGVSTLFLTAPSSNITCVCIEESKGKRAQAKILYDVWGRNIDQYTGVGIPILDQKMDCILINLNNYTLLKQDISYLESLVCNNAFLIVTGIRTNRRNQTLWKSIMDMDSRTVVLDLFNLGVIFFDKALYRWKYQISF